jgi:hypothetical protein
LDSKAGEFPSHSQPSHPEGGEEIGPKHQTGVGNPAEGGAIYKSRHLEADDGEGQVISHCIGIDPGRTGAFAWINLCRSLTDVRIWDMPPHGDERGIDLGAVNLMMAEWPTGASVIGLEWNTGRPGEVPDFAYRFGLQTGQLDGLLFARGFRVEHLSSQKWTRRLGLPGKTHAGAVQQRADMIDRLYPQASTLIRGPRGGLLDGRIDALLIAHYLRQEHCTLTGFKGGRRPPIWRGPAERPEDKNKI